MWPLHFRHKGYVNWHENKSGNTKVKDTAKMLAKVRRFLKTQLRYTAKKIMSKD